MKQTVKLKKNYEFRNVLKKGKSVKGNYIECFYIKTNKSNYNSLGIAISSKLCKAVKRNMIKRKILAAYTQIEERLLKGNIFIFLWRKNIDIDECSFNNIFKDMETIFKKIGILDEKNFN